MKRFVQLAFVKALVISVGFNLICIVYGLVTGNPCEISLTVEVIIFLVLFFSELIEYSWKKRKK